MFKQVAEPLLKTLDHGTRTTGRYDVTWNTSRVARGLYFVRLSAGDVRATRTIVVK